jgi:hypothetical protein
VVAQIDKSAIDRIAKAAEEAAKFVMEEQSTSVFLPMSIKELVMRVQKDFELSMKGLAGIDVEPLYLPGVSVRCEAIGERELETGGKAKIMWCKIKADGSISFRGIGGPVMHGVVRVSWNGEGLCIKIKREKWEEEEEEAPFSECLITRINFWSISAKTEKITPYKD